MKGLFALLLIAAGAGALYLWFHRVPPPSPSMPTGPRRPSAAGTVHLLTYASAMTKTGVTGFPPGTGLRIVEDRGDTLRLTDGTVQIEVAKRDTTDDLDLADRAARGDAAAQAELAKLRTAENQAAIKELIRQDTDRETRARQSQSRGVGGGSSLLNQPAQARPGGVLGSTYYYDRYGYYYYYDVYGRRIYY